MKTRYRLTCRGLRGGKYYCVDTRTGKRTSLCTGSEEEARQLVEAKNQAERQPVLNLQIAKAYLAAADSNYIRRTWHEVMAEFVKTKTGSNRAGAGRSVQCGAACPPAGFRVFQLERARATGKSPASAGRNAALQKIWVSDFAFSS